MAVSVDANLPNPKPAPSPPIAGNTRWIAGRTTGAAALARGASCSLINSRALIEDIP